MSWSMEFALGLVLFSPALVGIALIVGIVIADIQHKKETRYTSELLEICMELRGVEYTQKVLDIAKNSHLDGRHTIKLLEDACGVEHKEGGKKKIWDGLRTVRNAMTQKVK